MRVATVVVLILLAGRANAATIASVGDAAITSDAEAGTWTLTAGGAALTLAFSPSRDLEILDLTSPAGHAWLRPGPDSSVTVAGQTLALGSRAAGFAYEAATVVPSGTTLQLDAVLTLAAAGLRVTRHYAVTSGSPTFEVWTTYTATAPSVVLSDLNALDVGVSNGAIEWLTGLQGDNADVVHDSAFTLETTSLAPGEHFGIGATGRSSEQAVPWMAIDGAGDEFYTAIMWSGAWSLGADRAGDVLALNIGLGPMTTTVTADAIDGPHVLIGVAGGGLRDASAALRSYVLGALRGGQPLTPLVTYNTWFAYGTEIDAASMLAEMDRSAALGTELFVVDAGWYTGAGASGPFDFDSGLGTWEPDPARFPDGLKPLADHAHDLGMKFGIWVEPERANFSTMDAVGLQEAWMATSGGSYGSDHAGQICLASDAAREWLMGRLTTLIDQAQPDYLKWDNNFWLNCDRPGHGHGQTDGNFAHVNGLYDLLAALRARYPNLLIENVSGGGNRLDVGMLRYTDVAWMDDRTAPSVHVRHNVEGLSAVFPPAYLLSFVIDHDGEPLHDAPDLSLYFRSRMAAALGLCFRSAELTEGDAAGMTREIDIYKSVRTVLGGAAGSLLSPQAAADNGPAWDVLQEAASGSGETLLHVFQSDTGVVNVNVKPTGLTPDTRYEVRSVDTGVLGTASGADLMAHGIDVLQSPNSAAHLLIIEAK